MWVPDVRASADWYVQTLGFSERAFSEEWQWASLGRDSIELMLALPNAHLPAGEPQFTGSFYFATDDVEGYWNRLQHCPGVVYPIETFEWGMREFAIRDPNGYILQFGQEVQP
ncbi:VOC family protein [Flaviaesturariibacter terrae]